MIVAISALMLSLCGLFIAVYEATLVRQSQRASVWPHVQVGVSITSESITMHVQNTGVGPARIEAAAVYYNGEKQKDWLSLLRNFVGEKADSVSFNLSLINGTVLPTSSEQQPIFNISTDYNGVEEDLIHELGRSILQGDIDVTVCYSSVFGECWTGSLLDVLGRSQGKQSANGSGAIGDCESAPRSGI